MKNYVKGIALLGVMLFMIFGSKMSVSALEIENSDIVVKDIDEDSMNIEKEYVVRLTWEMA